MTSCEGNGSSISILKAVEEKGEKYVVVKEKERVCCMV